MILAIACRMSHSKRASPIGQGRNRIIKHDVPESRQHHAASIFFVILYFVILYMTSQAYEILIDN